MGDGLRYSSSSVVKPKCALTRVLSSSAPLIANLSCLASAIICCLHIQQILILTANNLEVFEVKTMCRVERVPMQSGTLTASPPSADPLDWRVAHSVKVYKGKVFVLVSSLLCFSIYGTCLTAAFALIIRVRRISALGHSCPGQIEFYPSLKTEISSAL